MNATTYLKEKYPMQHTFPFSQVVEEMEKFADFKHRQHQKKLEKFQTEMYLQVHKKNLPNNKDHQ